MKRKSEEAKKEVPDPGRKRKGKKKDLYVLYSLQYPLVLTPHRSEKLQMFYRAGRWIARTIDPFCTLTTVLDTQRWANSTMQENEP